MSQRTFFPPMRFDRIEVYDIYIPSLDSINLILSEIENESDRFQFIKTNNTIWLFGYIDIEIRELIKKLLQNYHKQGEVVGEDATEFIKSLAVVNWFAAMAPKMKEGGMQGLKREASKTYQRFKKDGDIEFDKPNPNFTLRYFDLKRFPEYETATKIAIDWYEEAARLSNDKPELRELMNHERLLIKQIFESREKSQNFPFKNQYINICQFCKKPFPSYRGGGRAHCGSKECRNKYSAGTTKDSRTQPHAIEEKKKRAAEKVATHWIKVDNTPRWCIGTCSKRRLVDKHKICNQCHDEGFSFYN
jgi:hypothetical protein